MKVRGATLGDVKQACLHDPGRVAELLAELRDAATQRLADLGQDGPAPTLVLPLDQAEELFSADADEQAEQFLALLADLVGRINAVDAGFIVAATIRTDRYEAMQNHPALGGLDSVLFNELKPMPPHSSKKSSRGPRSARGRATSTSSSRPTWWSACWPTQPKALTPCRCCPSPWHGCTPTGSTASGRADPGRLRSDGRHG